MIEAADIVVVGGGPVGAALALALVDAGFSPTVLESRELQTGSDDPRPLALSYGSRLILDRLGVWAALAPATPIECIHVSQGGGFGRVTLAASEARLPALGYVVDYARLHATLRAALAHRAPRFITGAQVTAVRPAHDAAAVELTLDGDRPAIAASLVAVADGGALGNLARVKTVDYGQAAVVATVTSEMRHRNMAFERFTPNGPLALLPCGADRALIWTVSPKRAQELCCLAPGEFLAQLHGEFGDRLGAFTAVVARSIFPLALKVAGNVAVPRTVLIGNAAQTLHPVAGQGFNLGLRDAWELAAQIERAHPQSIGSAEMLATYQARRRADRCGGIGFTHSLVRLFSNDMTPLRVARGLGLALLGCLPPVKGFVVRRMTFGARG
jgi:2-octaprenyl-6-methoxyphenol hydroxylase